jgi:hypothetical protein
MSVEDYSNLDISFDDIGDIGEEVDDEEGPGFFQKPAASNEDDADYLLGKPTKGLESAEYILGTLIVRVVAARDLEPVNGGGIWWQFLTLLWNQQRFGESLRECSVRYYNAADVRSL